MSTNAVPVPAPDKSIGPQQLASLQIRKAIFHDIPRRIKGKDQSPTLSEVECSIDPVKIGLLKEKLVRVLGSSAAYELDLNPQPESSIPKLVQDTLKSSVTSARFV